MEEEQIFSHFLLSGRRCGWAEDMIAYVCVPEEEDPEPVFIREILYGGKLPEGWQDRLPRYEENSFGDWADINGCIELPFGIDGLVNMPHTLNLSDFRLEEGKISATATSPGEVSGIAEN